MVRGQFVDRCMIENVGKSMGRDKTQLAAWKLVITDVPSDRALISIRSTDPPRLNWRIELMSSNSST